MDKKDRAILDVLQQNSRLSWKDVGEKVFLTGQAVGLRVQDLHDRKIIKKFTIEEHYESMQFITIYMDSNQFIRFEASMREFSQVLAFYKITGDGCYFIQACFDATTLELFLQKISDYGRYKVSHRLREII